jgi:hypothetical protein
VSAAGLATIGGGTLQQLQQQQQQQQQLPAEACRGLRIVMGAVVGTSGGGLAGLASASAAAAFASGSSSSSSASGSTSASAAATAAAAAAAAAGSAAATSASTLAAERAFLVSSCTAVAGAGLAFAVSIPATDAAVPRGAAAIRAGFDDGFTTFFTAPIIDLGASSSTTTTATTATVAAGLDDALAAAGALAAAPRGVYISSSGQVAGLRIEWIGPGARDRQVAVGSTIRLVVEAVSDTNQPVPGVPVSVAFGDDNLGVDASLSSVAIAEGATTRPFYQVRPVSTNVITFPVASPTAYGDPAATAAAAAALGSSSSGNRAGTATVDVTIEASPSTLRTLIVRAGSAKAVIRDVNVTNTASAVVFETAPLGLAKRPVTTISTDSILGNGLGVLRSDAATFQRPIVRVTDRAGRGYACLRATLVLESISEADALALDKEASASSSSSSSGDSAAGAAPAECPTPSPWFRVDAARELRGLRPRVQDQIGTYALPDLAFVPSAATYEARYRFRFSCDGVLSAAMPENGIRVWDTERPNAERLESWDAYVYASIAVVLFLTLGNSADGKVMTIISIITSCALAVLSVMYRKKRWWLREDRRETYILALYAVFDLNLAVVVLFFCSVLVLKLRPQWTHKLFYIRKLGAAYQVTERLFFDRRFASRQDLREKEAKPGAVRKRLTRIHLWAMRRTQSGASSSKFTRPLYGMLAGLTRPPLPPLRAAPARLERDDFFFPLRLLLALSLTFLLLVLIAIAVQLALAYADDTLDSARGRVAQYLGGIERVRGQLGGVCVVILFFFVCLFVCMFVCLFVCLFVWTGMLFVLLPLNIQL